ncbi:T9SS type A sorting domain-containing protein [Chryseobacterium suipulveris]|uniref:T9SS type A sorting domain-containing protein n=1 Tax=Chryseobacterium suipulveris TaxID=2929800 RepID=UPI0037BF742E
MKRKRFSQLYNSEGRLISSGSLNSGNSRINASHLKNGMYILQLKNAQGNSVKSKLLK